MPIDMPQEQKTELKEALVKRSEKYAKDFFAKKNIKTFSKQNCLPENVKLTINYTSFERETQKVGSASAFGWKENGRSNYIVKCESNLVNANGDSLWREVETRSDKSLDEVIEDLSKNAAERTAESLEVPREGK
jgi:hypothetical protein